MRHGTMSGSAYPLVRPGVSGCDLLAEIGATLPSSFALPERVTSRGKPQKWKSNGLALPWPRGRASMFRIWQTAAIMTAQLAWITVAVAAPPQHGDGALAEWYHSLKAPNGSGCCDMADCRSTESRVTATGYEALIENKWIAVPRERVLTETSSPTGRAVVCYQPGYPQLIYCFVRPPES